MLAVQKQISLEKGVALGGRQSVGCQTITSNSFIHGRLLHGRGYIKGLGMKLRRLVVLTHSLPDLCPKFTRIANKARCHWS